MTGVLAFLIGKATASTPEALAPTWPLINFSVAVLLFLLIVSLLITGAVKLAKTLFGQS